MSDIKRSSDLRDRESHIYESSFEEDLRTDKPGCGTHFWHHLVLLQVHYFTSALNNAGIAYVELIFNNFVPSLLDAHFLLSLKKSTQRFHTKQLRPPIELQKNECFKKLTLFMVCTLTYLNCITYLFLQISRPIPVQIGSRYL